MVEHEEDINYEDNIEEITSTSDTSCYEFCELYQSNGILACIDCECNPN